MAIIIADSSSQAWAITVNTDGSLTTTQTTETPTGNSFVLTDANGQAWTFTINTNGSLAATPTDTPVPGFTDSNCTVTLQTVVNLCQTHVDLMPLANVGGFLQEPALSLCNDVLQELCAQPYDWKFNGNSTSIMPTMPARQDYQFAGASAFVPGFGGVGIGLASGNAITEDGSNNVTVECLQPHNFTVGQTVFMVGNTLAAYNSTFLQTPTSSSWTGGWVITATPDLYTFQFVHALGGLDASGAPGIFDCSWLEHATMFNLAEGDPNPTEWEVSVVKSLKKSSQYGRPEKLCLLSQLNGVLTLRLTYIPQSPCYGITIHYQKPPVLKTDLSQTWFPFPDEFGFVYRQMFLARAYRYLGKPQAVAERQLADAMIAKALGKDDVEESDQYVTPERSIMGSGWDVW